jgi:hypothetical protein
LLRQHFPVDKRQLQRRIGSRAKQNRSSPPRFARAEQILALPPFAFGAKGAGTSVYFRDPDGSLMEFISYAPGI